MSKTNKIVLETTITPSTVEALAQDIDLFLIRAKKLRATDTRAYIDVYSSPCGWEGYKRINLIAYK